MTTGSHLTRWTRTSARWVSIRWILSLETARNSMLSHVTSPTRMDRRIISGRQFYMHLGWREGQRLLRGSRRVTISFLLVIGCSCGTVLGRPTSLVRNVRNIPQVIDSQLYFRYPQTGSSDRPSGGACYGYVTEDCLYKYSVLTYNSGYMFGKGVYFADVSLYSCPIL